jgi:hypothetical protein
MLIITVTAVRAGFFVAYNLYLRLSEEHSSRLRMLRTARAKQCSQPAGAADPVPKLSRTFSLNRNRLAKVCR